METGLGSEVGDGFSVGLIVGAKVGVEPTGVSVGESFVAVAVGSVFVGCGLFVGCGVLVANGGDFVLVGWIAGTSV